MFRTNLTLSTKQNMLWNSVGCLIYQACMWAMTIAVVIFSNDYENSGRLAFAMALGNIYYPLATYNMRTIQVSDLTNEYSSGQYIAFRFFTVFAGVIPVLIYLFLTSPITSFSTCLAWLLFKADEAFCSVFYAIEQRALRMDYIGISQGGRGVICLGLFIALLSFGLTLPLALIGISICCILITWLFDFRAASQFESVIPKINLSTIGELAVKFFPAVVTLVCYGSVVSIIRQKFGIAYGDAELGKYAAIATPTVLVQVAASYLYNPLLVNAAKCWSERDYRKFQQFVIRTLLAICCIGAVAILMSELIGKSVLLLVYGSSIESSVYLLSPALFATLVTTLFAFSFDILTVMRHLNIALIANVCSLLVAFVGCGILFVIYGANGINIAVVVSFGIGLLICLIDLFVTFHKVKRTHDEQHL